VIYSARFLRHYHALPHRLINRAFARITRAEQPAWLVQLAIRRWVVRAAIDMNEFEPRTFRSLEEFFLRALRPDARPIARGGVSPADGRVVALGAFGEDAVLDVKGHALSLARIVHGKHPRKEDGASLARYRGGSYVSLFLSPRGYHHVHMPEAGMLCDARWLPGRYFPQNERALRHIHDVYEQNERLVLRLQLEAGGELLLVMVGASLIGGIQLLDLPRAAFTQREPLVLNRRLAKGERLGHFTFGSTVIMILPAGFQLQTALARDMLLGQTLWQRA
jgi:phosphatidylserine decarboxylase